MDFSRLDGFSPIFLIPKAQSQGWARDPLCFDTQTDGRKRENPSFDQEQAVRIDYMLQLPSFCLKQKTS